MPAAGPEPVGRPAPASGLAPGVPVTLPSQRRQGSGWRSELPLPGSALPAGPAPRRARGRRRVGRTLGVLGLCVAVVGAVTTGVVVQLRADAAAAAWARAEDRVAADQAAARVDAAFFAAADAGAAEARYAALLADAATGATAVVVAGRAAADASPHAGDAALTALRTATDAVEQAAASAGNGTSPADLRTAAASVAAPQRAVVDAEAAWQAAEAARVAAEQAAAAQAAAARAEAERAAAQRAPRGRAGAPGASSASGPAAAAAPGWAAGVQAAGTGGLGASLNAARVAAGLPALTVTGSASLADHAATMAAAGSIWHSGGDHIVGWVEPADDAAMIQAYLDSPGHRAWILKEGRTTVAIGAVTIGGRLYTAMRFS